MHLVNAVRAKLRLSSPGAEGTIGLTGKLIFWGLVTLAMWAIQAYGIANSHPAILPGQLLVASSSAVFYCIAVLAWAGNWKSDFRRLNVALLILVAGVGAGVVGLQLPF